MPIGEPVARNVHAILGSLGSLQIRPKPLNPFAAPHLPAEPFFTVSCEVGISAEDAGHRFIEEVNAEHPDQRPWTYWDRELVEKVAADHHLSQLLVDALDNSGHSWLEELVTGLHFSDDPAHADETKVYRRVVQTIQALATAGRVVIVGRGGVFVTRKLPGGIHLRLTAPLPSRVETVAREHHLSSTDAAAWVKEHAKYRQAFYRRHWPTASLEPETFSATVNVSAVDPAGVVRVMKALVAPALSSFRRVEETVLPI